MRDLRDALSSSMDGKESAETQNQDSPMPEALVSQSENKTAATTKHFVDFFGVYDDVLPYLNLDEITKAYIEKKRSWISRLEQEDFPVAFLGSFSAGKSTIINAILGREVLPEATQSTTAFPTILRKGQENQVFLYYIDEDTKSNLWDQLCAEIGLKIDKNLAKQPQENYPAHLERIKKTVSEYEKTSGKIDSKPLTTLEQLFQGWGKDKYKTLKNPFQLADLKKYVEGHEDSLFIDRIEVHLKDINIPSDIILVDLPGLAVANPRHVQFTKEYIQDKAKAFVVCMKPKQLLEGQEIEFLEETNRANPTILQRSFWVINQWDTLNEHQRYEEEQNFDQKIQQYNFIISRDRFFKISALNYLLLACLSNGTLDKTEKLKNQISNLNLTRITATDAASISSNEAQQLLNHEEVRAFSDFNTALFSYLNTEAKDEFVTNAKSELLQVVGLLNKFLDPLYDQYNESADIATEIRAVEVSKRLDRFISSLRGKINHFAAQVRDSGKSDLWRDIDTIQIEKEIDARISRVSREDLKDRLQAGIDVEGILSRLPAEVEQKIGLTLLLREKLVSVIEDFFVQRLSRLLLELKDVNKEYLPDAVLEMLEDKLGKRDIAMRLNGLADSLFFTYGDELDRIGLSLKDCEGNTLEKRIGSALEKYKTELIKFTRGLVADLNKYVRRSVKNHAEYLEKDLLKLLDEQRERIITQIAQKINVSEAIAFEEQRRNIVKKSRSILVNLSNEL
jgi:GTP-binding protein EngB required for normal cell division